MSKHPGGRPSEYKKIYCSQLKKFFSKKRFEIIKVVTTGKNNYRKEEQKRLASELPTFEVFAEKIGISRDTLYEWGKKHKEFSDTMEDCRGIQKDFLIQNGLLGLYSSNFAIFVATNLTELKHKQEIDHTSKGEKLGYSEEQINAIIKRHNSSR